MIDKQIRPCSTDETRGCFECPYTETECSKMSDAEAVICNNCGKSFAWPLSSPYTEYCSFECAQIDDRYVEPTEDDLVSEDHQHWYQYGKCVLYISEDEDYKKALRDYMAQTNFFPNVFLISDHGNAHLINVWEE